MDVNSAGPRRASPEARATRRIRPRRSGAQTPPPNSSGRVRQRRRAVHEFTISYDPFLGSPAYAALNQGGEDGWLEGHVRFVIARALLQLVDEGAFADVPPGAGAPRRLRVSRLGRRDHRGAGHRRRDRVARRERSGAELTRRRRRSRRTRRDRRRGRHRRSPAAPRASSQRRTPRSGSGRSSSSRTRR